MAANNKNLHMSSEERRIIQTGIENGSTKTAIAQTIGKDDSTVGKEIKNHRIKQATKTYPIDCALFAKCKNKNTYICNINCPSYSKFYCKRRDRSPGACNGCSKYSFCHYEKYRYIADTAHDDYREMLVSARIGINATYEHIREIGNVILPLLNQGQSPYAILQAHQEIELSEKTLYTYIENGVFQEVGISISPMDLQRQVRRRKISKRKVKFNKRKDKGYLKGRIQVDLKKFLEENPNAKIVQMDTVYNDGTNGPFIQTFKFIRYGLLICIYHEKKTSESMYNGILLLETILGRELFEQEVEVLITDRGSEFVLADKIEKRDDGTIRTHIFYCDPMASWQKGSVENIHLLLREICPKEVDLYKLGLTSQEKANLISSHINSYPTEKLDGKTPFQLVEFFCPKMAKRLYENGFIHLETDKVILKPYLLKG